MCILYIFNTNHIVHLNTKYYILHWIRYELFFVILQYYCFHYCNSNAFTPKTQKFWAATYVIYQSLLETVTFCLLCYERTCINIFPLYICLNDYSTMVYCFVIFFNFRLCRNGKSFVSICSEI